MVVSENNSSDEVFGSETKINAALSYDDLITNQMAKVVERINLRDISGLNNSINGLELLFYMYFDEKYDAAIEELSEEYRIKVMHIRPDRRDMQQEVVLMELLLKKAKKLLEHAKMRGITPGKVIVD